MPMSSVETGAHPGFYASPFPRLIRIRCVLFIFVVKLLFAVAFSAAPLTLYVPPIRILNPFIEAMEMLIRDVIVYWQLVFPRIRLGVRRILAAASAPFGRSIS